MACCTLPWGPPRSTGTGQSAPRASTDGTSPVDEEHGKTLAPTSCCSSLPLPGRVCGCGATGSATRHASGRLAQSGGWWGQTGVSCEVVPTDSSHTAPFSPQQDSYPAHLAQLCQHHHDGGVVLPEHPPEILRCLGQRSLRGDVGLLLPATNIMVLRPAPGRWAAAAPGGCWAGRAGGRGPVQQGAGLTMQLRETGL